MNGKIDKDLLTHLINEVNSMVTEEIKIMEVCGTHTQMIAKLGLKTLLSSKIKLLSGPGCPVCVTEEKYIDRAIEILNKYDVTLATFGDLIKVRGSKVSLQEEKSRGKDVRIVYSPLDLIDMAEKNRGKQIVFLGVGFETTAPIIALAIKTAYDRGIDNLYFLTSIKLMSPVLHYIMKEANSQIHGLICPGHVATVKGSDYFKFINREYLIPAAVCGFEAIDIVGGIYYLVKQITQKRENAFQNLYKRCVSSQGNINANMLLDEVFDILDGEWRGIGNIEKSSLQINKKYARFDALNLFVVENQDVKVSMNCECKDILLGKKTPEECKLFMMGCNPRSPQGPCMVSTEGACAIAHRYGGGSIE
ncbi:hydrogenase formation protein HypD [Serpentinicella alkaliphila]|uniref:Hydrogenase maturation protein HypD n=1 Tax=Serpentinicella alkaliphila TaxID=1734049 RepID=A0A4R2T4D6_9FIRM|nr:hydrogenase formation protein HypD [Serpentinicella alkaliphila]QUH26401.1 hydrogenase formation protein HypD [Serpentinicella alkaliphila]TCP96176.1 hydrogenase maturation protein HypD [Serpentinicella alkaliphila]